jgi:hypothetical protein
MLVLGLLATGVLVPVAVTVGFKQDIPPVYRVLQQPKPSHRLVFAFTSSALAATARDVLPAHVASEVISWTALASSGIHVAAFSEPQAMQQALAHLAGAGNTSPSRSLMQSSNSSSNWTLKYALSDFKLVTDRQVTQVVDPMQLFDLAKTQTRVILQAMQRHGSSAQQRAEEEDEDHYLFLLEQQQSASQQQQRILRLRKAAAVLAASGFGEPETAAARGSDGQQTRRRRQLAAHRMLNKPTSNQPPASTTSAALSATAVAAEDAARKRADHPLHLARSSSRSSWGDVLGRSMLQAATRALPTRARPQLQLQQRQAQQQVQRGGGHVAWHLADAGLGVREAWNITSGMGAPVLVEAARICSTGHLLPAVLDACAPGVNFRTLSHLACAAQLQQVLRAAVQSAGACCWPCVSVVQAWTGSL